MTELISPYGGHLVDLLVRGDEREALLGRAQGLPSVRLSSRSVHDLELLAVGAFSPLTQFMCQADHGRVLAEMRMADGMLWPVPITLPVAERVEAGQEVALRSPRNELLAVMAVQEVYPWDVEREAIALAGRLDSRHPLVAEMSAWPSAFAAGPLKVVALPQYYDFTDLRLTPAQVRERLAATGLPRVVAFQTRNPLHRGHEELTKRAADRCGAALLLHPVVGLTKPGDVDHYTRVRTYKALVDGHYDARRTILSLLPLAMRFAGPREALWHAIIRRNYGASHFIVGRDHAGPGLDSSGRPFYEPYAAQDLLATHAAELGVEPVPFQEMVFLPDENRYEEADRIPAGARTVTISGTQVRNDYLAVGRPLPEWFTRPETARILADASPPKDRRGFCVWFTGLSGAGKSVTAEALTALLMEHGRQVTLLDGDVVRTHLSKGLGFSREDRDTNIRRIGFVAAEVVRHGGAAVCAAVSPYRATRDQCRSMVDPDAFVEVFVDTPLEVCEARDTKGLYARARRGEVPQFTGISDPYEQPLSAEVVLTTTDRTQLDNARRIVALLQSRGFLDPPR